MITEPSAKARASASAGVSPRLARHAPHSAAGWRPPAPPLRLLQPRIAPPLLPLSHPLPSISTSYSTSLAAPQPRHFQLRCAPVGATPPLVPCASLSCSCIHIGASRFLSVFPSPVELQAHPAAAKVNPCGVGAFWGNETLSRLGRELNLE